MNLLIKGGRVIDPASQTEQVADILIKDGKICEIGAGLSAEGAEVLDAGGKVVAPGLIDMHCHLREPGFEYKETIETGAKSAAMGGFTSVACMPNTSPVVDSGALVEFIRNRAAAAGGANVFPIGAISKGLEGKELAEIGEMQAAGAVAISDDGRPVASAGLMRRAIQYASMFNLVTISHCEELSLLDGGSMNEGAMSTYLGLKGISNAVEEVMVSRELILAETEQAPVHIAHVSTAGSVALVREAKRRGAPVTCETCPHYFSLTEEAVGDFDTNAKMNPPLRTEADRLAIIEGLKDGTIDAIATDHAPHHEDEKDVEFDKALNGIVGFETALGLAITYLVKPGHMTLMEILEKLTVQPARILRLAKGRLAVGEDADLVVFDPETPYTVDPAAFVSKSKNSPYKGYELYGKPVHTVVGGRLVVKDGALV